MNQTQQAQRNNGVKFSTKDELLLQMRALTLIEDVINLLATNTLTQNRDTAKFYSEVLRKYLQLHNDESKKKHDNMGTTWLSTALITCSVVVSLFAFGSPTSPAFALSQGFNQASTIVKEKRDADSQKYGRSADEAKAVCDRSDRARKQQIDDLSAEIQNLQRKLDQDHQTKAKMAGG